MRVFSVSAILICFVPLAAIISPSVCKIIIFKDNAHILIGFIVFRHGGAYSSGSVHIMAFRHIGLGKHFSDLPATVGAEVEETASPGLICPLPLNVPPFIGGFNEFVGTICIIIGCASTA